MHGFYTSHKLVLDSRCLFGGTGVTVGWGTPRKQVKIG